MLLKSFIKEINGAKISQNNGISTVSMKEGTGEKPIFYGTKKECKEFINGVYNAISIAEENHEKKSKPATKTSKRKTK